MLGHIALVRTVTKFRILQNPGTARLALSLLLTYLLTYSMVQSPS